MTITFTNSATEHDTGGEPTATLDRSEFTHEVPVHMTDMGEGKGKNRCHVAQRYVRVTKKLTLTSAMVSIAKVLAWFKQEGDIVKRNDVLCDIETKVGVGCLCHTKKVLLRHMDETHVLFFSLTQQQRHGRTLHLA
jgi:hypothetical protein